MNCLALPVGGSPCCLVTVISLGGLDATRCKTRGFPPDTLRGAMAAVGKRQSMTVSSTAAAAAGSAAVPRSTSQPGNCRGQHMSHIGSLQGHDVS